MASRFLLKILFIYTLYDELFHPRLIGDKGHYDGLGRKDLQLRNIYLFPNHSKETEPFR
jgi:hypothetical protein